MPFQQQSARYKRTECQCIWLITIMMTSSTVGNSGANFKAQQEILNNIQQMMLAQLLTNRNNNDTGNNHNEEEHNDDE